MVVWAGKVFPLRALLGYETPTHHKRRTIIGKPLCTRTWLGTSTADFCPVSWYAFNTGRHWGNITWGLLSNVWRSYAWKCTNMRTKYVILAVFVVRLTNGRAIFSTQSYAVLTQHYLHESFFSNVFDFFFVFVWFTHCMDIIIVPNKKCAAYKDAHGDHLWVASSSAIYTQSLTTAAAATLAARWLRMGAVQVITSCVTELSAWACLVIGCIRRDPLCDWLLSLLFFKVTKDNNRTIFHRCFDYSQNVGLRTNSVSYDWKTCVLRECPLWSQPFST